MTQLPNVNPALSNNAGDQAFGAASALNDVDLDDFLNLMLAELQNQDPLNPLENDELIAQISQIREVGATEQLTQTLESVLLGQNIASATSLIGAKIDALSDDNQLVSGVVQSITINDGEPRLHLDLAPKAEAAETEGRIEPGTYQYRVVWEQDGQLFGVDPLASAGGSIRTTGSAGVDQSVLLSNLPATTVAKQIYRKQGDGNFQLVDVITDPGAAAYLDVKSAGELSETVLAGTPQLVDQSRSFSVRLKNVGEIRPPGQ